MDAHRTISRAALVALVAVVSVAVIAIGWAFVLAVFVPEATDPAAWGTPPAIVFATVMVAGFLASLVAALLGGRLLASAAVKPHASPDAVILAVFTVIGSGAIALWAFGVGIGLDPPPTWLDPLATVATAVALMGALVAAVMITDRLQRARRARG